MNKYTGSILVTYFIVLSIAWSQVTLGPRIIGTAGTFMTQSRGDDVIGWNPANLGYPDNPEFTLSFGIIPLIPFPSFDISNSALSVMRAKRMIFWMHSRTTVGLWTIK
jgi:hypothetical protein